ncbi:class I SAM-dependent methyltransferase [Candidatus Spongiihabitans sp.]|uniref:class I SAM-dependent methyltransferase n=1 Tax=Candidatus Spongiihabitans sp. TaxID=3101308 RepID=UPI003C7D5846
MIRPPNKIQPNKIQAAHSAALANVIRECIERNHGWISFEQFMALALYAPGLGYYSAGAKKIGAHGDFITAPLLGKQFAGCLARQCNEIIENLAANQPATIAEFGAGTGRFALDFLIHLDTLRRLPHQYLIIETSADLKQRQKQLIETSGRAYLDIIKWCDAIPETGISGVIIANELLDALPVMRFQIDDSGQAKELGVSMIDQRFDWQVSTHSIPDALQQRLSQYSLPPGYQSEIGAQAEGWVRAIGEKLISGVMILIDYGFPQAEFYHWDRAQGTLMCHYQHIAHDNPFYFPGIQDMTAHVDFSAIAAAGQDAGLQVMGYCGQGGFLLSLGLLENFAAMQNNAMQNNATANPQSLARSHTLAHTLAQEIKTLTLPHQMGELFKVITLAKNYSVPLSGFAMHNHQGRL